MKLYSLDRKTPYLIPIILFVLSLLLRLALISKGPYHSDCLYLAHQATKIVETHQMHYLQGSGLPLTALIAACFIGFLKIFSINDPVFSVNVMSAVFGALSVVALYLCVKKIFDERTALISALILSINPLFLALSTFGNAHPLSIFFLLLSLSFLFSHLKKNFLPNLILSGICFGLMGAARAQDFIVMTIPLCFLFLFPLNCFYKAEIKSTKYRLNIIDLCLFFFFSILTVSFFYMPLLFKQNLNPSTSTVFSYINNNFFKHFASFSFYFPFEFFKLLIKTLSPIEWICSVAGLIYLFKKDFKLTLFFLIWFIVPLLLFSCLIFFNIRLLTIILIPLIIIESYFVVHFLPRKPRLNQFFTITVISLIIINLMRYYPILHHRHQYALLPDFFTWISRVTEPDAYIIERDHSLFIKHYSKRKPMGPEINLYGMGPEVLNEFKDDLDSLLNQNIPVYITKYGILHRPKYKFREFMIEHYTFDYIGGKMIEDWHLGCLNQVLVRNDLLKIRKKE